MPTTAPAIRTKMSTLVIPFFKSAFSPEEMPCVKKESYKKNDSQYDGKIALIVSEISFTEFSIPPIWANKG